MSYPWLGLAPDPVVGLAFKVLMTFWLVAVAVWDSLARRIPNWLVVPVALLALGWQVYEAVRGKPEGLVFCLGAWVVLYTMWRVHVFGGGDAKFLMALFAIFPTGQFLLLFSLVVLAVSIPIIVVRHVLPRLSRAPRKAPSRTPEQGLLPTAEALRTRGQNFSWTFALPGVIYLWVIL